MILDGFRQFKPSGHVSARFIGDQTSKVKALLGPVGGGKSVACVYDSVRRPSLMPPCNDGIIRYRRAICGTTYGQLERNLYPTWKRWLPEDGGAFTPVAEWKGGGGRSAVHRLEWEVLRGNRLVVVQAEYVFAAVGDLAVEEFMRGFEPTDFWLYEVDQQPEAMIDIGITRLGRYPATSQDGEPDALPWNAPFTPMIVCDLNAPDVDSWFYQKFEEDPPKSFSLYKQPSGVSPRAENLKNLRPGYYQDQIDSLSKRPGGRHLVTRMVHARYAPSAAGEPVYADEYSDDLHLSPVDLVAAKDVPLVLCFDQGLGQPACLGLQFMPTGATHVLFEVVPGRMSARRFAETVRREIEQVCPGIPLAEVHYADPAGFTGADTEDGELAWAEIVSAELGIEIVPAETNEIDVRHTVVVDELLSRPGLYVSRRCKMLRKGFVSHYMYEKRPQEKSQNKKPVKNLWANPHDALQYGLLGKKGRYGAIRGPRDARAPERRIGHKRNRAGGSDDCKVIDAPVELG
ncbi:MAG: hypothetical protein AB7O57_04270 [Hyphomicrobiaceae bacterium]